MYTLYKFHFLNGITEINQLFDDILIIWPAPVYILIYIYIHFWSNVWNDYNFLKMFFQEVSYAHQGYVYFSKYKQ